MERYVTVGRLLNEAEQAIKMKCIRVSQSKMAKAQ